MDIDCTGWRFPRIFARRVALGALFAGLIACAQHPAGAQDSQEKAMQGQLPTDADIKAAGDRAAAASDAAADAASAGVRPSSGPSTYANLPEGPALTAAELASGFVRMAAGITSAQDTTPERVGSLSGWQLKPDERGERYGVRGQVGQGRYELAVWKLMPDVVGNQIELKVYPGDNVGCALKLAPLQSQLEAAGFEGRKAARSAIPQMLFRKDSKSVNTYVTVLTGDRDAPDCAHVLEIELESTDG